MSGIASIQDLLQPPESSPVQWLDGVTPDNSAPEYLMPTQRRRGQLDKTDLSTVEVRIGDLGGGMSLSLAFGVIC